MQILLSDFFQFDVLSARRRRASSSKHRVIATWSLRVFEHCFSIEFPIVFRLSTDLLKPCVDSMLDFYAVVCAQASSKLCLSFVRQASACFANFEPFKAANFGSSRIFQFKTKSMRSHFNVFSGPS